MMGAWREWQGTEVRELMCIGPRALWAVPKELVCYPERPESYSRHVTEAG